MSSRTLTMTPEALGPFILDTRQETAVLVKVYGRRIVTVGIIRVLVVDPFGTLGQSWLRYDGEPFDFRPGLAPIQR